MRRRSHSIVLLALLVPVLLWSTWRVGFHISYEPTLNFLVYPETANGAAFVKRVYLPRFETMYDYGLDWIGRGCPFSEFERHIDPGTKITYYPPDGCLSFDVVYDRVGLLDRISTLEYAHIDLSPP